MRSYNLEQLEDAVHDEATILVFMEALSRDWIDEEDLERESPSDPYGPGHRGWENGTIGVYLEAAWTWAEASKNGLPLMPKEGNPWKRVAQILHAGKIYEYLLHRHRIMLSLHRTKRLIQGEKMLIKSALATALLFAFGLSCIAQEKPKSKPIELDVLKASVGVWDAEIEVWSQGPDSPSIKFKGVETNRPYGEYWIASDFDSEFMGQTMKIHSIVGYDLDQKKMVGTVIDHGAYAASMTGDYDKDSKTIRWNTEAKDATGKPMVQKTSITQKSANERVLVLSIPGEKENEFTKFMQIRFVKRE